MSYCQNCADLQREVERLRAALPAPPTPAGWRETLATCEAAIATALQTWANADWDKRNVDKVIADAFAALRSGPPRSPSDRCSIHPDTELVNDGGEVCPNCVEGEGPPRTRMELPSNIRDVLEYLSPLLRASELNDVAQLLRGRAGDGVPEPSPQGAEVCQKIGAALTVLEIGRVSENWQSVREAERLLNDFARDVYSRLPADQQADLKSLALGVRGQPTAEAEK
jgi:hypothetical protein